MVTVMNKDKNPSNIVSIGWLIASRIRDESQNIIFNKVIKIVRNSLEKQFPEFHWEMKLIYRPIYPEIGIIDPLPLLELGAEEKLYRNLDYVVVMVPNELRPRERIYTTGVPSSALETAVVSSARFLDHPDIEEKIAALALHLLGHLFGVEHGKEGIMCITNEANDLELKDYTKEDRATIKERLLSISDARIEEGNSSIGSILFLWKTLITDFLGILKDIIGYAPWRMPLHLRKYTTTTAVTVVFIFLSAESWELGGHLPKSWLIASAFFIILIATIAIYLGQNLHQMGRVSTLMEQLMRTRIVLFGTLLTGIASLWGTLFVISSFIILAFPKGVFSNWAGIDPNKLSLVHYATFMANLGVIAGAFGGNLEEESEIKAVLLFDEEA